MDDRGELGRDAELGEVLWLRLDDGRDDLQNAVGQERQAAAQRLVEERSERPNVRPLVDASGRLELLGSHIRGRTDDIRLLRQGHRRLARLRDPEVDELDRLGVVEPPADEEVLRFEIAMDDSSGVGFREPVARLERERHRLRGRERTDAAEAIAYRLPFEQLHHDERLARGETPEVEDLRDVLAREPRDDAPLALEARDDALARRHPFAEKLDRDDAMQLPMTRRDDDPHPAGREDTNDQVLLGDDIAGTYGQSVGLVASGHSGSPHVAR